MILIVDCGSNKVPKIEQIIKAPGYDLKTVKIEDLRISHTQNLSGIIISGAPILFTESDPKHYLEKVSLLFESKVPVLGICFGHQLMALFHKANITKGEVCRKDIKITATKIHPLLKGLPETFLMNQDHCEYASLPDSFDLLARSEHCLNEAMFNDTLKHYGVQFHPETSGNNGQILINNFLKMTEKPSAKYLVS